MKRIEDINRKIMDGGALVYTADEFKKMVREGERIRIKDVDVVTAATCAVMSGTAAILSIPVAERGAFERVEKLWLNGIPAFPGPCPNERVGIVDAIVYGTSRAGEYGGGHLFRDIVDGGKIEIEAEADGEMIRKEVTKEDIQFSRLFTTRSAFRNYSGFVNTREGAVETIFSVSGLKGPYREVSVSGCGEINPIENDPSMRTIDACSRILVNGAVGYVMGEGTRSSKERRNLSVFADMGGMQAKYMGGFVTSKGPECITSIAVPIPVIDDGVLANLRILDGEIGLPIADIHDRVAIEESDYGRVWGGNLEIYFDEKECTECDVCDVERLCPTGAFSMLDGMDVIRCFNCGACVDFCPGGAFKGNLGEVEIKGRGIPITLRQSNRKRASELSEELKGRIQDGTFLL